jgi:hypothetical protein
MVGARESDVDMNDFEDAEDSRGDVRDPDTPFEDIRGSWSHWYLWRSGVEKEVRIIAMSSREKKDQRIVIISVR